MKDDPALAAVLCAGLEAQGFIETAARGDWRRWARWGCEGGEAYYVKPDGTLWFSAIRFTDPDHEVQGPILDRTFDAGCERKPTRQRSALVDADSALDELTGGSSVHKR